MSYTWVFAKLLRPKYVCDIELGIIFLSCSLEGLNSHGWPNFIYSDRGQMDRGLEG